ncbi:hypothetical protein AAHB53_05135 [Niallia circulans]
MNIMNKLTLRNLKENKRRTLVTIIGVIISVSMLTAVATLGVSFIDLLKRDTIARGGEWHAQFIGVNSEQAKEIKKIAKLKKLSYQMIWVMRNGRIRKTKINRTYFLNNMMSKDLSNFQFV